MKLKVLFLLMALITLGCSTAQEATPVPPQTEIPTDTPTPQSLDNTRRASLEIQYELLRQTQEQAATIWTDLQAGRAVPCTTTVEIPFSPSAITGDDSISQHLYQTALALQDAVALWEAECQNPRQQPPPDVIERGVLAALAAGDSLRQAQELLASE